MRASAALPVVLPVVPAVRVRGARGARGVRGVRVVTVCLVVGERSRFLDGRLVVGRLVVRLRLVATVEPVDRPPSRPPRPPLARRIRVLSAASSNRLSDVSSASASRQKPSPRRSSLPFPRRRASPFSTRRAPPPASSDRTFRRRTCPPRRTRARRRRRRRERPSRRVPDRHLELARRVHDVERVGQLSTTSREIQQPRRRPSSPTRRRRQRPFRVLGRRLRRPVRLSVAEGPSRARPPQPHPSRPSGRPAHAPPQPLFALTRDILPERRPRRSPS